MFFQQKICCKYNSVMLFLFLFKNWFNIHKYFNKNRLVNKEWNNKSLIFTNKKNYFWKPYFNTKVLIKYLILIFNIEFRAYSTWTNSNWFFGLFIWQVCTQININMQTIINYIKTYNTFIIFSSNENFVWISKFK